MSRRLLLALATSLLVAACAKPEVRDAQRELRREEAKIGVITRIVDVTIRDNPAGAPGQRINVLLMNEQSVYVAQPTNPDLRVGDRVRIEDTPSGPRVVPQ
jgi:hypothetical protein